MIWCIASKEHDGPMSHPIKPLKAIGDTARRLTGFAHSTVIG